MRFFFTLALSLILCHLSADEPLLQTQLKNGKAGDFVVLMQGKTCTLLHLISIHYPYALLEEVTIPALTADRYVSTWRTWISQGAPNHSSWILYQLNLEKGSVDKYYSVTKQCYFTLPEGDNFFYTLLHLDLNKIPPEQRKKVGFAPWGNSPDTRLPWEPKMVFEGQTIPHAPFDAYVGRWPDDGGPLSGKIIEVYLPQEGDKYPSYFPYWLQVRGVLGPSKVRVIESGRGLVSPFNSFPH